MCTVFFLPKIKENSTIYKKTKKDSNTSLHITLALKPNREAWEKGDHYIEKKIQNKNYEIHGCKKGNHVTVNILYLKLLSLFTSTANLCMQQPAVYCHYIRNAKLLHHCVIHLVGLTNGLM